MASHREILAFCSILAVCIACFFHETLFSGKVLSPADVLFASASWSGASGAVYEPANRLLIDPVLQFQPWLEFNRRMIRSGRLPLWNGHAGCGVPHLASGQSAVFDPFHLVPYLGTTPAAYAWLAAGRLWVAGLGMFLLARSWQLGFWGRWFAGLVYPFCGFLVVWLQYPVTAVAIWMPWLFLATDRLFATRRLKSAGWLAVAVALVVLGGHIQTSAHVLLAGGLYAAKKGWTARAHAALARRATWLWALGVGLGMSLAAVQIVPLSVYLTKSPVWATRQRERPIWWALDRPRVLDAVCTAAPYVFGSQRRGHPNLARALGVHNINESAGGYAGLAALIWLAPLAVVTRGRSVHVRFLTALVVFGAMGAFRVPPVDNLLRLLPVLDVTDNRRLTLWVAFGLTLLGGIGLDQVSQSHRLPRTWLGLWVVAACLFASSAVAIRVLEPHLQQRATDHYRLAAAKSPGADPAAYERRAARQVRQAVAFVPRYHGLVAGELLFLAALAVLIRLRGRAPAWVAPALLGLTAFDLALVGFGFNPAIDREQDRYEPPVITHLRRELPARGRAVGVGEELPPNVLMRFGLADVRNYDSVELARSLDWFEPLYEPNGSPPSSRGAVTWESVVRAADRLRESGVSAIVAAQPPPPGSPFARIEQVGQVWIACMDGKPWADSESSTTRLDVERGDGWARLEVNARQADRLVIRETWDPGWRATIDGVPREIQAKKGVFLSVRVPEGHHQLILTYDPVEVRLGLAVSLVSLVLVILVLTEIRMLWIPGIELPRGLEGAEPPS
jgi:Bacterial membrane protein YfhO